jgi:hypothetical protein
MRWFLTFGVTVATAMLLLLWRGDFNLYVHKEHRGLWLLKDEASLSSRLVLSSALSVAYGGVNTFLLYVFHKLKRKRLGPETGQ